MLNPYPHMTIATSTTDSDGENVVFTFVFGHQCPPEEFDATLREAVAAWMRSEDAKEYAVEQWPVTFDWIEVLGQIPAEFLTDKGIARLDQDAHSVILDSDEELVPEDVREEMPNLFLYGPEGEESLQGGD